MRVQAKGSIVPEEKILFVDDEPAVLDGYQRLLRNQFRVSAALGGEQALTLIQSTGPFAVVISDMRMPGMNGAQFLARVREQAPNTVRMLLTGHADLDVAIEAVNEGKIFQFLTKPCEREILVKAIRSGLETYRVAVAEKEIVHKAELISRSQSEWDSDDLYRQDEFDGRTGLPGPSRARSFLEPLLGADSQGYAILLKLTLFAMIEERYGEAAAIDYLKSAVRFLKQALRPEDQLFHWSRDVLMAFARRQVSPAAMRMEFSRLMSNTQQHIVEANGKRVMVTLSLTFDLLPVARFASLDQMLAAFDAKLTAKL
jgi:FixJ family two-component response regulator/GGDEF domain-containing protein